MAEGNEHDAGIANLARAHVNYRAACAFDRETEYNVMLPSLKKA
jgi:hypothetical protein